ncbi:MAG: 4'-phosphopantetheinyl transferase superfamily protein [Tenacibaculum sp.]|uniref:4'-phosphopantetheinyl transferase family protein n=1 Tax=Tenacibaculum sp. TaxID=1906242 RepID=UPI0017AA8BCB|nr:4'-phosphopantetheinyl transferase superfamily protein [Tenacibaculum sp.]NVK09320.1 4'-phosphopantetheinyl transferase superfamily protein [Tenacibaculum sp.]
MSVYIFYSKIDEVKHQSLLESNLHFLPKNYQNKLLRYRRWQDVQLSLIGRLLLKKGMSFFDQEVKLQELYFTKYNKPYFEDNNVSFNISHSGEMVVVYMTNKYKNIGIDIEENHKLKIEDFKNQMTDYEEEKIFNSNNPLNEFFTYWTQKEAALKAHGNGLLVPLQSFEIKEGKTFIESDKYYVTEVKLREGYSCHVASQQKINKEHIIIKEIDIDKFIKA